MCEGKNHKHLKNTLIYRAKQFIMTKKTPKKVYMFSKMMQVDLLNT